MGGGNVCLITTTDLKDFGLSQQFIAGGSVGFLNE